MHFCDSLDDRGDVTNTSGRDDQIVRWNHYPLQKIDEPGTFRGGPPSRSGRHHRVDRRARSPLRRLGLMAGRAGAGGEPGQRDKWPPAEQPATVMKLRSPPNLFITGLCPRVMAVLTSVRLVVMRCDPVVDR